MPFAKKNLHVQLCLGHQTSSLNYQRHRHVNKTRRQTTWVCKFQVLITSCEKASQWEPWISAGKNGWYPINLDTKFRIPIIESKKMALKRMRWKLWDGIPKQQQNPENFWKMGSTWRSQKRFTKDRVPNIFDRSRLSPKNDPNVSNMYLNIFIDIYT